MTEAAHVASGGESGWVGGQAGLGFKRVGWAGRGQEDFERLVSFFPTAC